MDRYVVIGNPVAHSLSPAIHAAFAAATGQHLEYETLLVPLGEFARGARSFFDAGGRGANVTLPFKVDAFAFADRASDRAQLAGAANFLMARDGAILADNTDGAGLVADLRENQQVVLRGARILLLGAGGAARGVAAPLLAEAPSRLVIANRTRARAEELAARFSHLGPVHAAGLEENLGPFDVVVNATSSSTHGEALVLPPGAIVPATFAYDMAYGPSARAFVARAQGLGARATDGLGMLVEQAAESFAAWRGTRPATPAVLRSLRARFPG
jgi:shikimate dehydrogenase